MKTVFFLGVLAIFLVLGSCGSPSRFTDPLSDDGFTLTWAPGDPPERMGGWTDVNGKRLYVIMDTGSPDSFYVHTGGDPETKGRFGKEVLDSSPVRDAFFPYSGRHASGTKVLFPQVSFGKAVYSHFLVADFGRTVPMGSMSTLPIDEVLVLGGAFLKNLWVKWDSSTYSLSFSGKHGISAADREGYEPADMISNRPGNYYFYDPTQPDHKTVFLDTGNMNFGEFFTSTREGPSIAVTSTGSYLYGPYNTDKYYLGKPFLIGNRELTAPFTTLESVDTPESRKSLATQPRRTGAGFLQSFDWIARFDTVENGNPIKGDPVVIDQQSYQKGEFFFRVPRDGFNFAEQTVGFTVGLRQNADGKQELFVASVLDKNRYPGLPAFRSTVSAVNGKSLTDSTFPEILALTRGETVVLDWIEGGKPRHGTFLRTAPLHKGI